MPMNSPRYTPIRASQVSPATEPSFVGAATVPVAAPIENIIDPATGWPSSEITR